MSLPRFPSAVVLGLLLMATVVRAADLHITANALLPGRAMLTIEGRQQLLRVGESSPEGVKLLAADANSAQIELDGRRITLVPGADVGTGFAPVERREVAIQRSGQREYNIAGSINGQPVDFLVDTGANVIAINGATARRVGIDYRLHGQPSAVQTAGGVEQAWSVTLDRVELSGILVRNVRASVLEGDYPTRALLGMSWLEKVSMQERDGVLYLREK